MSASLGIAVDLLVAILLIATIVSSLRLSRRIARMKADEASMRATIADLVTATDTAERAIATLKATLGQCDHALADRLRDAERYAVDLAERVQAGETVMSRIAQIVDTTRRAALDEVPPRSARAASDGRRDELLRAAAAAAGAVAERSARRLGQHAA